MELWTIIEILSCECHKVVSDIEAKLSFLLIENFR